MIEKLLLYYFINIFLGLSTVSALCMAIVFFHFSHFEISMKLIKLSKNVLLIVTEFLLPWLPLNCTAIVDPFRSKTRFFPSGSHTHVVCVLGGVPMRRAHGITSLMGTLQDGQCRPGAPCPAAASPVGRKPLSAGPGNSQLRPQKVSFLPVRRSHRKL